MYTFTAIRPRADEWWVVAVSWDDPTLIIKDEKLAKIIGMTCGQMTTEIIRYYGAESYDGGGTYWTSEFEAKKAIQIFFQPRLTAALLAKGNKIDDEECDDDI